MSCIDEYVKSRPPHALLRSANCQVYWCKLDNIQTLGYTQLLNLHLDVVTASTFVPTDFHQYEVSALTETYHYVIRGHAIYMLLEDDSYHQIRQFDEKDFAEAQLQLAQIIPLEDFSVYDTRFVSYVLYNAL